MKRKETQRCLKEMWPQKKKQCSGDEVDVSEVELSGFVYVKRLRGGKELFLLLRRRNV